MHVQSHVVANTHQPKACSQQTLLFCNIGVLVYMLQFPPQSLQGLSMTGHRLHTGPKARALSLHKHFW